MEAVFIPLTSAIVGGLIVHFLTLRRDRLQSRRDFYTRYLVEAFNVITSNSGRKKGEFEHRKFEDALSVIQLFGNQKQINLALDVAKELVDRKEVVNLVPLLSELRKSLRNELELEKVEGPVKSFRFNL